MPCDLPKVTQRVGDGNGGTLGSAKHGDPTPLCGKCVQSEGGEAVAGREGVWGRLGPTRNSRWLISPRITWYLRCPQSALHAPLPPPHPLPHHSRLPAGELSPGRVPESSKSSLPTTAWRPLEDVSTSWVYLRSSSGL